MESTGANEAPNECCRAAPGARTLRVLRSGSACYRVLWLLAVGGGGRRAGRTVPPALDCPGRVRRAKAEPHAVAPRA